MTRGLSAQTTLSALAQRLRAAARVLLGDPSEPDEPSRTEIAPAESAARLLPRLVAACRGDDADAALWLVATAVAGAFPTPEEHRALSRLLELSPDHVVESALLEAVLGDPSRGRADLEMDVIDHGVVVDVDFCARHDTQTGIQRVVRTVMPLWQAAHDLTAAAWVDEYSAMRRLAPREEARVFAFGRELRIDPTQDRAYRPRLLVPWHSVVILPDVPNPGASAALAALAQFSGNELALVGYDMIPVTSAETRPTADAVTFAQYLTVIKHAHRVAGISRSATTEFAGFASALAAQGLTGPAVSEVVLTEETPPAAAAGTAPAPHDRPLIVCVGTHEPHKNHRTVLHAAERLWREGARFDLRLIGGPGWTDTGLAPAIAHLQSAGWPLETIGRVSDGQLWSALREASFTVFISLHEGYGLPVAESLACGTPVITSNFGSQQEIAERGGCLTVDPRDDDSVTAAMRRLLEEPATLARLRSEAVGRRRRTWDEYATELWATLVEAGGGAA
ncbi:MAG: glycosyltransferase family 4 protein [Cellulomonas sp.]